MYSQDESVRALIDKFMFNPVYGNVDGRRGSETC